MSIGQPATRGVLYIREVLAEEGMEVAEQTCEGYRVQCN